MRTGGREGKREGRRGGEREGQEGREGKRGGGAGRREGKREGEKGGGGLATCDKQVSLMCPPDKTGHYLERASTSVPRNHDHSTLEKTRPVIHTPQPLRVLNVWYNTSDSVGAHSG